MPDFGDEAMKKWRAVLPGDVEGCLGDEGTLGEGLLATAMSNAQPEDVTSILPEHVEELAAWGRGRRLRLMAWVVNSAIQSGDSPMRAMADLAGEDDEGNGGSRGAASGILHADFVAFMTALGGRTLRSVLNADAVDNALGAAVEIRQDMGMGGIP